MGIFMGLNQHYYGSGFDLYLIKLSLNIFPTFYDPGRISEWQLMMQ